MTKNIIQITKVRPADVKDLQRICRQTFFETFASENTESDMQKYLEEEITLEKLTIEVSDPTFRIFFIKVDNLLVGYITFHIINNPPELKILKGLKIERLYILRDFQGKKFGQILLDFAMELAGNYKMDYVWLGVWERNYKAIRFYEKNGFVKTGTAIFMLGDDQQTDFLMKKFVQEN
jgi:diamine N-acetyltransferase